MPDHPEKSDPRLILLGASNLTRGLSALLTVARERLGSGLEVYAALGRGRSFGINSSLCSRVLPGIDESPLWEALDSAPPPTERVHALITDIGNDVMYGVEPAQIVAWVDDAAARILRRYPDARLVMTQLPLERIRRITPAQYWLVKRVLFPGRSLTLTEAVQRAVAVASGLERVADQRGLPLMDSDASWYGADPIHIRYRSMRRAWSTILEPWWRDAAPARAVDSPPSRPAQWWTLARARPFRYSIFGRRREVAQPAVRLRDGTTVSLY